MTDTTPEAVERLIDRFHESKAGHNLHDAALIRRVRDETMRHLRPVREKKVEAPKPVDRSKVKAARAQRRKHRGR